MTTTLHCCKLNQEETALPSVPFPGELGKKIQQHVSKKAWDLWCLEEVKFINENRLDLTNESARQQLEIHMIEFLKIPI